MVVNDDPALADVEALLRRTLYHKAENMTTPPRSVPGASGPTRRPSNPRHRWTAAAACAVVVAGAAGIIAFREARDDSAAPASTPTAPAAPTAAPTTTTTTLAAASDGEPGPDPDGPHTAYATISGGTPTISSESLTLVGGDIDTAFRPIGAPDAAPGPVIHNRRVDGVLYVYLPQPDGSYAWTYDPDDVSTLSLHPTGDTPFELYGQVADSATFDHVGDDEIDGIPVRRVTATTPEGVDAELLRLGGSTGTVKALDLWVTSHNVVLRIEATLSGDPPTQIVVEFNDVGDPDIELAAPIEATELDAAG